MKKRVYTNPEDELEARANRYTVKGLLAMIGLIIVIWVLTMCNFFIVSKQMMTEAALVSVCLLLTLLILLWRVDNAKPWLKYIELAVICISTSTLAAIMSFHAVLAYVIPLVFAGKYTQKHVIWVTFSFNTVTLALSEIIAFYFGLCDLNIFFVSMGDYQSFMNIVNNNFEGLVLNENPVFVILVYATIPRTLVLFLVALMFSHINEKGRAEAAQMARLKVAGELDFLTGTYNKNKYQEMTENFYPNVKTVSAVYWDLNNLKETNDSKGHSYGDMLISRLSQVLIARAGRNCKVYRLGGDEFLMLIENPSVVEEETYIRDIREMLGNDGDSEEAVSVAVGTARGSGTEIIDVVNRADAAMYENKRMMKGEIQ